MTFALNPGCPKALVTPVSAEAIDLSLLHLTCSSISGSDFVHGRLAQPVLELRLTHKPYHDVMGTNH